MTKFLTAAAMTAGLLALGAGQGARAAVVTFDGGTLQTFNGGLSGIYTENGLEFDIYGAAPSFVSDGHGGHALRIQLNNDIIIHPVAGGTFALESFDFLGGGDTEWGGFHGDFVSGGENNHAGADVGFFLSGLATTEHLAAIPAWGNITDVDWCGYCVSGFAPDNAIDNVTFDLPSRGGAAPEPAAWLLMIAGMFGMGHALRRNSTPNRLSSAKEARA